MPPTDHRSEADGGQRLLAPLALLLVGTLLAFWPALISSFEQLQIRSGDPTLVHYILEHSWRWAAGDALSASFWDPPCYAPFENLSAHSDVMLGTAPVYWLWRLLGLAPGVAYQLWMITSFALIFVAMHLLLRRHLGTRPWPSAVGAFLVAYGSARLANFNSPQLFAVFPAYFALLFLGNALRASGEERPRAPKLWFAAFVAACVLQAWSAYYPAFFLLMILVAAGAAALVLPEPRRKLLGFLRAHGGSTIFPLAIGVLLLATLASHYLSAASESGTREWTEVERGLPTWASWLYCGSSNWLYGLLAEVRSFQFTSAQSQHANGVGFLTAGVALVALFCGRKHALVQTVALATLGLMLVTTRFGEAGSLWKFAYDLVPGADAIRYVARLGGFLALPVGIGVACLLDTDALRVVGRPAFSQPE